MLAEAKTITGVEFKEPDYLIEKFNGDIGIFLAVLKAIIERYKDIKVTYSVGNLPEGSKKGRFCKLEDGITPRKYAFAEVIFNNFTSIYLVEIERCSIASTIPLMDNWGCGKEILNSVVNRILESLVDNNGNWDNKVFDALGNIGIGNQRFHHTSMNRKIWELADKLMGKIVNMI
jgi:hypothetical protein